MTDPSIIFHKLWMGQSTISQELWMERQRAINNPRSIIDGRTIYNPRIIIHRAGIHNSRDIKDEEPSIIHEILYIEGDEYHP